MKNSFYVLFALMLLMACKPTVPSQFIQPGDLEDILYDYHVSQAIVKTEHPGEINDFEREKAFRAVLNKYGLTKADFDSSMVWYYSHLPRLKQIYLEVNERLADNANALGAAVGEIGRYSQFSASGDTANIWTGVSEVLLMPRPTMNRFDFTIKADTSYYKGDSFMFQFMADYIWQTGLKDAVVCIVTKYEGDSILQVVNHVSVGGLSQVRLPANSKNKVKSMTGYIYLGKGNGEEDNTRKMMFISQIQLIRFHNKETNDGTKNDSIKTDSLQRSLNPGRERLDPPRGGNFRWKRVESVSAGAGNAVN